MLTTLLNRCLVMIVSLLLLLTVSALMSPVSAMQSEVAGEFPTITARVALTDGSVDDVEINSISESGIEVLDQGAKKTIAFKQVANVSFALDKTDQTGNATNGDEGLEAANRQRGSVTFVDGSEAVLGNVVVAGLEVQLETLSGTNIAAKIAELKMISFLGDETTEQEKKQWDELLAQPQPAADAIVVSKNGALQMIEGVVGDIGQDGLTFTMGTRTADVALEKIKGAIFYRAKRELADPICQCALIDGSLFSVREITLEKDGFRVTSVSGAEFVAKSSQIKRLNFSDSRSVWLSDLVPTTNDWTPLLASPQILESLKSMRLARFNEDFRGDHLTLKSIPQEGLDYLAETQSYDKGIAMSGGGRVVFALNQQFKQLTGLVGFDPDAHAGAVVRFVVKTDGETAISEVLRSDEVLQPIKLDLDVSTTHRISIAIEYEDGNEAGDVLHLADFKVLR